MATPSPPSPGSSLPRNPPSAGSVATPRPLGAFGGGAPNIIWGGTPAQIEQYGIPCVEGKKRAFVAITEPTGGSDPRNNISTRAVKRGDTWVLNGRKMWITAAEGADYGIIFARSKDGTVSAPPEITAFIVEPTYPGISFNEIKVIRALSPYEIVLDNCEVPAENVLGLWDRASASRSAGWWTLAFPMPPAASAWRRRRWTWLAAGSSNAPPAAASCRQAGDSMDDRRLRSRASRRASARL